MDRITIDINKENFPILYQIKEDDLSIVINKIFTTGYNILYPNIDKNNIDKYEHLQIIDKLDELKYDIVNDNLNNKINTLEITLNKLIGLSSSSNKKGLIAENILENIIKQRYGDIRYEKKSLTPHCGDAWLYLPDDKIIMLESKNYTETVPKAELTKLESDMITNNIRWAIMISFNSEISGMKEFDYHIFNHNNETYNIIIISNLSNDITRLDVSITIIRKLMNLYSDLDKFPWIVSNIKKELSALDQIYSDNFILRERYSQLEQNVIESVCTFNGYLISYHHKLESQIKSIIKKINNTIDDAIVLDQMDYSNLIANTVIKDKKLVPILMKLIDIFKKKKIIYNNDKLYIDDIVIAEIKIKTKKIILTLNNYDLIFNFIIGNDKEIIKNLKIFENLNL